VIQHLSEMMLFLNYCIISGSAEALVMCGGKLKHLLIAYFLGNTFRMHLAIAISAMVSSHLGAMSRIDNFLHQA